MTIKIILLICFLIMIFGVTIFAVVLVLGPIITGFKKAPYVPSFDYHLKLMKKHLKLKKGSTIVDLGCGDGKVLRFFYKEFGLNGTGYDLNPFVIRYGKAINRIFGFSNILLIRSDFKQASLKCYDYIYLYLWPEQLIAIEDRIFSTMNDDAIIISNSFTFAKHIPFDIICDDYGKNVIYLYKK